MKAILLKTGFDEGLVVFPEHWAALGVLVANCQHVKKTGYMYSDPYVPSVPILNLVEFIDWPQEPPLVPVPEATPPPARTPVRPSPADEDDVAF